MKLLKQAFRNIISLKQHALLIIVGLTIGLSSFTFIAIWTFTHWSFDKFYQNKDQLYLLYSYDSVYNEGDLVMPFPMAPLLRERFPELEHTATYTYWPDNIKIEIGNKVFHEELTPTEEQIFNILEFDFIEKNSQLFASPGDVALSESVALKFFGTTHCIGQNLLIADSITGTVAAVYRDFPQNSTFKPPLLCSYLINPAAFKSCKGWNTYCYYVLTKIPAGVDKDRIRREINEVIKNEQENDLPISFYPLKELHLNHPGEIPLKPNLLLVFFSGLLVLSVSIINFINLLSTGFLKKSPQMGIRKMLGATTRNIVKIAFAEIFLYVLFTLVLTFFITALILPIITQKLGLDFIGILGYGGFAAIHLLIAFIVFLGVSIYPVLFYTRKFRRHESLTTQGKTHRLTNSGKAFLIFQFTIAIFIGIVAFVMQKQLSYAIKTDKGYNAENVLYTECWYYPMAQNKAAIKAYLEQNPNVESFSFAERGFNGLSSRTTSFYPPGSDEENEKYKAMFRTDENLFETMGVKMVAGRFFEPKKFNEKYNIVINETFARQLGGIDSAMNLPIKNGYDYHVVGVCQDFLFENFHTAIEPLVIQYNNDWASNILIKTVPGTKRQVADSLDELMKSKSSAPFKIALMSDLVSDLYETEKAQQSLLLLFGFLTLLVSCFGLLGLIIFVAENKTKEIGIRKVNGATIKEIILLLNQDFIKWIFVAFIIATPIAWYAMHSWLENFAYKTNLSWWIFALAGMLALAIALITVSWQSWKAAKRNPVESLRYE